jgi:hypothetical protein
MDAQLKAKWVEALRSGEYTQARYGIGNQATKELCCLGVAANVLKPSLALECTNDAVDLLNLHGLDGGRDGDMEFTGTVRVLIDMNDTDGKSFAEIADYIEAKL